MCLPGALRAASPKRRLNVSFLHAAYYTAAMSEVNRTKRLWRYGRRFDLEAGNGRFPGKSARFFAIMLIRQGFWERHSSLVPSEQLLSEILAQNEPAAPTKANEEWASGRAGYGDRRRASSARISVCRSAVSGYL